MSALGPIGALPVCALPATLGLRTRLLGGVLTPAGAAAPLRTQGRTVLAALAATGALARRAPQRVTGALALAGAVDRLRVALRQRVAACAPSGAGRMTFAWKALAATVAVAGSALRRFVRRPLSFRMRAGVIRRGRGA